MFSKVSDPNSSINGAMVDLVDQCEHDGFYHGREMMEIVNGDESVIYADLVIARDTHRGVWVVYQTSEFDEEDCRLLGRVNVAYEGEGFLRAYDEEEANTALAEFLESCDEAEYLW